MNLLNALVIPPHPMLSAAFALILSAMLCLAGGYLSAPSQPSSKPAPISAPLEIPSSRIRLIAHQPNAISRGSESLDARVFSSKQVSIDTELFPYVELAIEGGYPGLITHFFWRNSLAPSITHRITLPSYTDRPQFKALYNHPQWRGQAVEVGAIIIGKIQQRPIRLKHITLEPHSGTNHLRAILAEWLDHDDWTLRSINYYKPEKTTPLVPLNLAFASWTLCALIVFAGLTFLPAKARQANPSRRSRTANSTPYYVIVAIFVTNWVLLDGFWETEASARLSRLQATGSNHTTESHPSNTRDSDIIAYARHLRLNALPDQPTRILILHSPQTHYHALKLKYHLLPHITIRGDTSDSSILHENYEYVIVTGGLDAVEFHRDKGTLTLSNARTVHVELIHASPLAFTFRIQRP